jgi:hypothetical protein
LDGDAGAPQLDSRPRAAVSEIYHFEVGTFPDLVATADLVVIGTVLQGLTERFEGDPVDGGGALQINRFEFDIEEVLAGRVDSSSIVVRASNVVLYSLDDITWTQSGERSVLFLTDLIQRKSRADAKRGVSGQPGDVPAEFMLVNSQGAYRIEGQDDLKAAVNGDDFAQHVVEWSLPGLLGQIDSAKGQIERGEVQRRPTGPRGR